MKDKSAGIVLSANKDDLPYAQDEFNGIKAAFEENKLICEAIDSNVKEKLDGLLNKPLSLFYFIGHARYDIKSPETGSGLLIPDGEDDYGYFTIEMIKQINMNIDTVILTACETAMSSLQKKDEYRGFPRMFMEKGSMGVLAACWEASDSVSYEISKRIKGGLLNRKQSLSSLLLNAQKEMSMDKASSEASLPRFGNPESSAPIPADPVDLSHPFYWSPFMYYGV